MLSICNSLHFTCQYFNICSHSLPNIVNFCYGFHSHLFLSSDANFCYFSLRGSINFLDLSLVYIKFLFLINKQFSTDSYLDCEGYIGFLPKSLPYFLLSSPDHCTANVTDNKNSSDQKLISKLT